MKAKRFGAVHLGTPEEWQLLMTAVPNADTCATVSFVNQANELRNISMVYTLNTNDDDFPLSDHFLNEHIIAPNEVFYVSGLVVESQYNIYVKSNYSGVGVMAYGFVEEN